MSDEDPSSKSEHRFEKDQGASLYGTDNIYAVEKIVRHSRSGFHLSYAVRRYIYSRVRDTVILAHGVGQPFIDTS